MALAFGSWTGRERRVGLARAAARPQALPGTDDAVRQEDHQHHQQRAEHQEAVFLEELQVLGQPGHGDRAEQRAEQGPQAADQHVHGQVEGVLGRRQARAEEADEAGIQAPGDAGLRFDGGNVVSGSGAASFFGGGARGNVGTVAGGAGSARGGGGSGGSVALSATGSAGGAGADGLLWIWEFE